MRKITNREVSYYLFFTNITGDVLCKTQRVQYVVHMEEIRNACTHAFTSFLTHSLTYSLQGAVLLERYPVLS